MDNSSEKNQTKRAINQVKMSAIRQIGNVLLKSLTHFLASLLKKK